MIPSLLPTYNRAPLTFVKGEGSWLIEADGRRFLDLGAGIAVNALGHANPELVKTLTEQANALWHTSNLYQIPAQQTLADKLVEATFADTVFFTNSGTEAAELAIKMARKYHYERGQADRVQILSFDGAFHGRSTGAIAAAGLPVGAEPYAVARMVGAAGQIVADGVAAVRELGNCRFVQRPHRPRPCGRFGVKRQRLVAIRPYVGGDGVGG